jgi:hypothetical protein
MALSSHPPTERRMHFGRKFSTNWSGQLLSRNGESVFRTQFRRHRAAAASRTRLGLIHEAWADSTLLPECKLGVQSPTPTLALIKKRRFLSRGSPRFRACKCLPNHHSPTAVPAPIAPLPSVSTGDAPSVSSAFRTPGRKRAARPKRRIMSHVRTRHELVFLLVEESRR